jgi:N-methylhydantoinase B
VVLTAGGGGWGDPLERDPEKVRWDVIEGYISMRAAHEAYGVVLDPDTLKIDWERTTHLRDDLRKKKS